MVATINVNDIASSLVKQAKKKEESTKDESARSCSCYSFGEQPRQKRKKKTSTPLQEHPYFHIMRHFSSFRRGFHFHAVVLPLFVVLFPKSFSTFVSQFSLFR